MAAGLEDFGATLRRRRIAAGLTQEQLAEVAGLSARGIQDLERGVRRVPQAETLRRLVAVLGQPDAAPALPVAISSFVGRQREIAEVRALVGARRLVTLTGTGGIGKTRLALEVAAAAGYADGVQLVELAPLADAALVLPSLAAGLCIREQSFRPLIDTVRAALAERRMLLVLDNCEHVLAACATLVDTLLRCCPGLDILATSREPLGITGETTWRVPPLQVPDLDADLSLDELAESSATALFVERARAVAPSRLTGERAPGAIVVICRRLEGVPLAIELAAAQTRLFTPEQIATRLDEALRLLSHGSRTAPVRHQTLRATLDWSFSLLSEPEKRLFEYLSIFAGGCSFEAAEAIAGGRALDPEDVLDVLGRLVDKSLVVAEPTDESEVRYRLQEVLRQFSQERLAERPRPDAAHQRHAEYFLKLVKEAEAKALAAPANERKAWLDRLELELDNFRAAGRWFVARGDAGAAQELCAGLYRLLVYRGHATAGRAALVEALALPGGPPAVRARALHCLASLAFTQADYRASTRYGQQSLSLRLGTGDQAGIAWSYTVLAFTATMSADWAAADGLLRSAREASRNSDDTYALGLSLSLSALAAYLQGDLDAAHQWAEQTLQVADSSGFASIECMALSTLGSLSYQAGDRAAASVALGAALARARALGEAYLIVRAALGLALVAAESGDTARARTLLTETLTLARRLGNPHHVAQALEGTAAFASARARPGCAARFAGAASAIRFTIGAPLSPIERSGLDTRLGPLEATNASAFGEGQTWSIDHAVARALAFVQDGDTGTHD